MAAAARSHAEVDSLDIVVCGAQAPFMRGGAELHMENLVQALSDVGHRADLVRLPVAWDKDRLFDAPLAWRMVPVDADLVIATNFPSYFVQHPRKIVWLFHQHRAAYDAIDTSWSDFGIDEESVEALRLLSEWDTRALEEAERLFTTSGVVAARLARYNGLRGTPLYHPPPLHDRLRQGPLGDYVFCPTRLERNKRPELLVTALVHAPAAVRGVLAGAGSMAGELERLAHEHEVADRTDLRGFVDDDELVKLYADALAVIYAPLDEDYGYVTLQAFLAGKPVITSTDAGGVLEWVEDSVTGLVTDGSPQAIGEAVGRLDADREWAAGMGRAGRERVKDLNWPSVVGELLQ